MQLLPEGATTKNALPGNAPSATTGEYGQTLGAALDGGDYSSDNVNSLRSSLVQVPTEDWVQNLQWTTLYTAQILATNDQPDGLPQFMRSNAWKERKLNSALGVWAAVQNELGHLSGIHISESENGGSGAVRSVTAGYVEPDPVAWSAIASEAR